MAKKTLSIEEVMAKKFVTERDLVNPLRLRETVKSSQNLRSSGKEFLTVYKFGRNVRYLLSEVLQHLEENKVVPEAE